MPSSIHNALLSARTPDLVANSSVLGAQVSPSLSRLENGNYVVVWTDAVSLPDLIIRGQVFSANGQKIGSQFDVSGPASGAASTPVVAGLSDGGFVVTWNTTSGTTTETINGVDIPFPLESEVYARKFSANGVPEAPEFRVNLNTQGLQGAPSLTALENGGYFISYLSLNGYDPFGTIDGSLIGTIYDNDGVSTVGSFRLNNLSYGLGVQSHAASFDDGSFVVVWDGLDLAGQDRSGTGITLQRFNADGTKNGETVSVNQTTNNLQTNPKVTVLENGAYVVAWNDWQSTSDASQKFDIRAQVFSAQGAKVGSEIVIAADAGVQIDPNIAAFGPSGFVVTWTDESGIAGAVALGPRDPSTSIKAQLFDLTFHEEDAVDDFDPFGDGLTVNRSDVFQINEVIAETQNEPEIIQLDDSRFAVVWSDYSRSGSDNSDASIRTKIVDLNLAPEILRSTLPALQLDAAGYVEANLVDGRFFDPEGGELTYRLLRPGTNEDAPLPDWLSFDGVTGLLSGVYEGQTAPAFLDVTIQATDPEGATSEFSHAIELEQAGLSQIGSSRDDTLVFGLPERVNLPNGEFALVFSGQANPFGALWNKTFFIERYSADGLKTQENTFTARTPYEDLRLTPVAADGVAFTQEGYVLSSTPVVNGRERVATFNVQDTSFIVLFEENFTISPGMSGLQDYEVSARAGGSFQLVSTHILGASTNNQDTAGLTALFKHYPITPFSLLDTAAETETRTANVETVNGDLAAASDGAGKTLYIYEHFSTNSLGDTKQLGFTLYSEATETFRSGQLYDPFSGGQYFRPTGPIKIFDTDLGYFVVSIPGGRTATPGTLDYRISKETGGATALYTAEENLHYLSNGYSVQFTLNNGLSLEVYDPDYNRVVQDYDLRNSTSEIVHFPTATFPDFWPEITDLGGGRFRLSGLSDTGQAVFEDFAINALMASQTLSAANETYRSPGTDPVFIKAGAGADHLTGSRFNDTLIGEAGNDTLIALGGADRLLGGDGNDVLRLLGDGNFSGVHTRRPFDDSQLLGGAGLDTLVLGDENYFDLSKALIRDIERIDFSRSADAFQTLKLNAKEFGHLLDQPGGLTLIGPADDTLARRITIDLFDQATPGPMQLDMSDLALQNWSATNSINIYGTRFVYDLDIQGSDGTDFVFGSLGQNHIVLGDGADTAHGYAHDDVLIGDNFQASYAPNEANAVFRLYRATLDRDPDTNGHANWTERLFDQEIDLSQAASGFVRSREFQQTYGALSNEGFVELLYENVLDRPSDPGGLQNWLNRLVQGDSREDVVLGFAQSLEFRRATASNAQDFAQDANPAHWSDEVYRVYRSTLDRDPDQGGFENWINRLAQGDALETVVTGFVNSPEFRATYDTLSDSAFVELLYQNVLGRGSDPGGLANWLARLGQGDSRAEVVLGFSESSEFKRDTVDDLNTWMRGFGVHDRLIGAAGENILAGGLFSDSFEFNATIGGTHTILDLELWDTLEFTGFGYLSDAEARANMVQNGSEVVFTDGGVAIHLQNTTLSQITDDVIMI